MRRIVEGLRLQTTVDGIDLGVQYVLKRAPRRSAKHGKPVTVPSEMAGRALRVTLGELSSYQSTHD
ncbi:MAG: hypothetical protein ACRD3Q_00700 [Terriglobales bacterium]